MNGQQIQRVYELITHVKSQPDLTEGQLEDLRVGLVPLPIKPEPIRVIPDFPLHAYNFLMRSD